jgi:hypothetical protein
MQRFGSATPTVSLILFCLCACSGEKANSGSALKAAEASSTPATSSASAPGGSASAADCDASLWNRVYSPKRLQQAAVCSSATGVIAESDADPDGDQHLLLKLDPGQETLVNKRNKKKKDNELVIEIVCANPTTMKKPLKACAGYTNRIPIPAMGQHVKVTGTYVLDTHNGWMEIHPVSRVERQ